MSFWADGMWADGFWADGMWAEDAVDPTAGSAPTNSTAGPIKPSYEVCQLSGFKFKRGTLVRRWDGLWVSPEFNELRHPSDYMKPSDAEALLGAERPEPGHIFIDPLNPVQASDL